MSELYKKYRPKTLKGLVGQRHAVESIKRFIDRGEIPHTILLSGPSGCGKTTVARILKRELKCDDNDFQEINCSDFRGIEMVRDIRKQSGMSALSGGVRMWLIDECHMLSKDAQHAFLKLLEDTPKHVYFSLATTEPRRLLPTILNRCSEIKLNPLTHSDIISLVNKVVKKEDGLEVTEDVATEIADAAEGSARKALVLLEQVGFIKGEAEQMAAIQSSTVSKDVGIGIARALINPRVKWGEVAKLLKEVQKDEVEGVRHIVLAYCSSVMLGGGKIAPRAYRIADVFSDPFYDSHKPGLVTACWEVVNGGE